MDYKTKIVADSVGPNGVRVTTMEFNIWKPLLAEFNTHGLLGSRNFPSSRAIPWPRMREKIINNPHIPMFRKNNRGMQPAEPLSASEQVQAEKLWLQQRDMTLETVERMGDVDGLNIHKQWLNRLLEPWITVTGLVTATEWDNFFNLRLELNDSGFPMAQDEFYFMARSMKKALDENVPEKLQPGNLHLPYITSDAREWLTNSDLYNDRSQYDYAQKLMLLSAGKCATVSYDNLGEGVDHQKDYNRAVNQLLPFGHMSVFQHQATCREEIIYEETENMGDVKISTAGEFSGQLRGWIQFRKAITNEACWVSPNADKELALSLPELITI